MNNFFKKILNFFTLKYKKNPFPTTIYLSKKDYEHFVETLRNPPEANEKLKELMRKYDPKDKSDE
jgi:hypothetical protein